MIRLLLLLLLIPSLASATGVGRTGAIGEMGGPVASGGGTCNVEDTQGGSGGGQIAIASASGREYIAAQFIAGDWDEIKKIELCLSEDTGDDVDDLTYTIQVYSDDSNSPDSLITNATCTFSGALVPVNGEGTECGTTYPGEWVGCTFENAVQFTNTELYHVIADAGGGFDAFNNVIWSRDATGSLDLHRAVGPNNTDCTAPGVPYTCCTGSGTGTCEWAIQDSTSESLVRFSSGETCTDN